LRLLNIVNGMGEWGLRFKFDALPAEPQDRVNRCGGVGESDYYIGICGEGKLEGKGCQSLEIPYETVGKSVKIGNLSTQYD